MQKHSQKMTVLETGGAESPFYSCYLLDGLRGDF